MITPFDASGQTDPERAIRFGFDFLSNDVAGLALFGTTSKGKSQSVSERMSLLDAMIAGGGKPANLMVGTGSCTLPDAVSMTKHAANHKCGGVLLLPPYFYKAIIDEGIFQFAAELIEQVGNQELRIYLCHIPPVPKLVSASISLRDCGTAFPSRFSGQKQLGEPRLFDSPPRALPWHGCVLRFRGLPFGYHANRWLGMNFRDRKRKSSWHN